jgi:hypothetical protein
MNIFSYDGLRHLTTLVVGAQENLTSLISKLDAAEAAENRGNNSARNGALGAYRNELSALSGKRPPAAGCEYFDDSFANVQRACALEQAHAKWRISLVRASVTAQPGDSCCCRPNSPVAPTDLGIRFMR